MDWQDISTAPKDGTRVRLAHDLDPSSRKIDTICPTFGRWVNDEWQCESGFVCIDGYLRFEPTLWLPAPPPPPKIGEDHG